MTFGIDGKDLSIRSFEGWDPRFADMEIFTRWNVVTEWGTHCLMMRRRIDEPKIRVENLGFWDQLQFEIANRKAWKMTVTAVREWYSASKHESKWCTIANLAMNYFRHALCSIAPIYATLILIQTTNLKCTKLYTTSIINFPHINELLPSTSRNLVWYPLLHQRLICGFDGVHLVSRSWYSCGKIVDTSCSRHFEDVVLTA